MQINPWKSVKSNIRIAELAYSLLCLDVGFFSGDSAMVVTLVLRKVTQRIYGKDDSACRNRLEYKLIHETCSLRAGAELGGRNLRQIARSKGDIASNFEP